jgi:hypothetical protein
LLFVGHEQRRTAMVGVPPTTFKSLKSPLGD